VSRACRDFLGSAAGAAGSQDRRQAQPGAALRMTVLRDTATRPGLQASVERPVEPFGDQHRDLTRLVSV
jgi:hypothetical protein